MVEAASTGPAATKLRAPEVTGQLVRRARLDGLLDAGIGRHVRLMLVSAPAGSGKSTLVASWAKAHRGDVAWLQAEESDADPARFWSYLADAVAAVHPSVADAVKPVVVGSRGDDVSVVSALVNALTDLGAPLVIVVDDYHLIDNEAVHRGMERLIDLCPPGLTVVLSTRVDPPFRLGRLRVRDQLAEVREADLRFDTEEATGLLGSAAAQLDADHLAALCARTEGWAAGLVLAGLSLKRAPDPGSFVDGFRGDDHLVVEYLRDELLAAIDEDDRRRLLETSVLDALCGPLVDAVTATTGGAGWLRDTAGANQLVIALDRTGTWFRYHHLLRDLLRLEAHQELGAQVPELHARAAAWFEAHGDRGDAIAHLLAAGDARRAADLMWVHGPQLLKTGQIDSLRSLLEQLGEEVRTSAACSLLWGWCEFIAGHHAQAEEWVEVALAVAPAGFDETVVTPLRMNLVLARGDVGTALGVAEQVVADGELASHASDLATATGAAYTWAGRADDARAALDLASGKASAEGSWSALVVALVCRAIVELHAAPAPAAHAAAVTALDAAQRYGLVDYHGVAPAHAVLARTDEDPVRARTAARHAVASARRASTDLALGFVLTMAGDTLIDDAHEAGAALLRDARRVVDRCPDPGIVAVALARAESRHGVAATDPAPVTMLVEQLTDRELAVLRYLPTALSQRDIAAELYVSLNTVKTHCRAIYRKLGVGDRKAAVQVGRDLRLL